MQILPHKKELKKLILRYLAENRLMTLATSDRHGRPWASTVFFAFDEKRNFYFLSERTTRHAKNIMATHRAAAAINQKPMPPGKVAGIQFEGTAHMVQQKDLGPALKIFSKRHPWAHEYLAKPSHRAGNANRLFKISPGKIYYIDDAEFPKSTRVGLDIT